MTDELYSIRMRASREGRHISGAEQIVRATDLDGAAAALFARARGHERGVPDTVTVTANSLAGREILRMPVLPITDIRAGSVEDGLAVAIGELVRAGVSLAAATEAVRFIASGASASGGNMRGAVVMDAADGTRLEPDRERGVRTRAVDYDEASVARIKETLEGHGLNRIHLLEALALASKVAHAPGSVAELCISDDPGYVTGYVASQGLGYVRITPMKRTGDLMGGRVFFVDGGAFDQDSYMRYMREVPVLVGGMITINTL